MAALSEEWKIKLADVGPRLYREAGSPAIQYPDGDPNPGASAVNHRGNTAEIVYVGKCSSPEEREAKIHKMLSGK